MESEEYRDRQSGAKTETIGLLKDTVARLEAKIKEIETKSAEDLPDLTAVRTWAKSIDNWDAVKTPQNSPSATKTSRNNRRTIAILSGIVVLIVAGFWLWLSPPPLKFLSGQAPSPEPEVPEVLVSPEITEQPPVPPTVTVAPEAEPTETAVPETSEGMIPLELNAPGEAVNMPLKKVEPKLQLTPEQSLIAAVRERVTTITQDYSEALILAIRADFTTSKLSLSLSDEWYELTAARQKQLANEILERSRKLDFQKLELKDANDNLIARSPVVGDRAIIYSNQQEVNEAK